MVRRQLASCMNMASSTARKVTVNLPADLLAAATRITGIDLDVSDFALMRKAGIALILA